MQATRKESRYMKGKVINLIYIGSFVEVLQFTFLLKFFDKPTRTLPNGKFKTQCLFQLICCNTTQCATTPTS